MSATNEFVVGFNPVPMANQVALIGARLQRTALAVLVGLAVTVPLAVWRSDQAAFEWLALAVGLVSVATFVVTLVQLVLARRHLAHIGAGPALEATRAGLVMHGMDGSTTNATWDEVGRLHTAGLKVGATGPQMVVEGPRGPLWAMPLSFLDALPGTIDAGIRAASNGRVGLDLSALDSLF